MTAKFRAQLLLVLPHLAALITLLLCARLALWQVDRAGEKQLLIDQWDTAPLGDLLDFAQLDQFSRALGQGRFDSRRHVLLDNQIRLNHPGVHVFTPLTLDNGDIIMVNRGWQPWIRGQALPEIDTPEGIISLEGRVSTPPQVGFRLGTPSALDDQSWPNLMTYYDTDLIASALNQPLADRVLLLDPEHPAHLSGDAWPRVNMGPERHIGYAVQWVSIGTAVLLLWVFLSYRSWRRR